MGSTSNGFSPKKIQDGGGGGAGKRRSCITDAFAKLTRNVEIENFPQGGNICLYELEDWTFHAKGLWLSTTKSNEEGSLEKDDDDDAAAAMLYDTDLVFESVVGLGN